MRVPKGQPCGKPAQRARATIVREFFCGSKRYCGEMGFCAEARYYLNQCGLTRLDGDGDGVPCE